MLSQFGVPDLAILSRLAVLFGLQFAFAYDPSGRSVCGEHLFLDVSRVPRSLQQTGPTAHITFWLMELTLAIAHQGVGPDINERLTQVQTELVAAMLPEVLRSEMSWPYE